MNAFLKFSFYAKESKGNGDKIKTEK